MGFFHNSITTILPYQVRPETSEYKSDELVKRKHA